MILVALAVLVAVLRSARSGDSGSADEIVRDAEHLLEAHSEHGGDDHEHDADGHEHDADGHEHDGHGD